MSFEATRQSTQAVQVVLVDLPDARAWRCVFVDETGEAVVVKVAAAKASTVRRFVEQIVKGAAS